MKTEIVGFPARCRDPEPTGPPAAKAAGGAWVRKAGFTLVEVMVATWVSAMMVTAFFSVALSSRVQTGRSDHRLVADQEARRVLEMLRSYVADPSTYQGLPNGGVLPADATCNAPNPACWALADTPGTKYHDVSQLLINAGNFTDVTAGSVWMRYQVLDVGQTATDLVSGQTWTCPAASGQFGYKCVRISANWEEQGI